MTNLNTILPGEKARATEKPIDKIVAADFFTQMPASLQPLLHSGILLSSVAAVLLNLYFNGYHPEE